MATIGVIESHNFMNHHRPFIIINNIAARARRVWPLVRSKLRYRGLEFGWYETTGPGDATIQTRTALRDGFRTIAVVGGDGTLGECAEGFFSLDKQLSHNLPTAVNPDAVLCVLPSGTGDDYARGLVGCRMPLDYWLERFVSYCETPDAKEARSVDVMYGTCFGNTNHFICLNASTMGIGGETAARVAAQGSLLSKLSGEARFMIAAVGALAAWRERRVRISVDGSKFIEGNMNLVAIANGLYAGGGMMLSPEAKIDDGKLDVIAASGLTRAAVIRELPRIHAGGHIANPNVRITQGTQVRVETFASEDALLIEADGNMRGNTPAEFRIMPRALRFVV